MWLFIFGEMNEALSEILTTGLHKEVVSELAAKANSNTELYGKLIEAIASGERTLAMKASWILGTAARIDAEPANQHGSAIFSLLQSASVSGVQRELLKVMETVKLEAGEEGEFVGFCFALLRRPSVDIGIRHFCVRILIKKAKLYPELIDELIVSIEETVEWHTEAWKRHSTKAIAKLRKSARKGK